MSLEYVTGTELARRLGVSEGAVRKHVKRGLYSAERSGLFDLEKCRVAWHSTRDPEAVLKGAAGGAAVAKVPSAPFSGATGESSLSKARTAVTVLKAQREQLELQRSRGEVIGKADALRACLAVATIVNERIDGAAAQIGPRVVGLDAAGAERVAREILDTIRREISQMGAAVEQLGTTAAGRG